MSVYRINDGVILTGPALDAARYAVDLAQRARAGAGLPVSRGLATLLQVLSPPGHTDSETVSPVETGHMITTAEAAEHLGCSIRTVRRLAPGLGGRLSGGQWLIDPQAVRDHLDGATIKETN